MIHLALFAVRFVVSTWLVLVGVVYALAAVGATAVPPSRNWGWMALGLACIHTGIAIASYRSSHGHTH